MATTLAERVRERLDALQMTPMDLARHVGVRPPSVYDWLNGNTKNITGMNLINAADALQCDPAWLHSGESQPAKATKLATARAIVAGAPPHQSEIEEIGATVPVPLIEARVNGGPGSEHDSEDVIGHGYVQRDWLERTGYRLAALKQVRVIGDSMAPKICDGDKVIINTDDAGRVDGAVYVVRVGDALRVKRLYSRMDRKAVELKSDATGTTELIDADAVRIIGRVVMLHREHFSI